MGTKYFPDTGQVVSQLLKAGKMESVQTPYYFGWRYVELFSISMVIFSSMRNPRDSDPVQNIV